MFLIVIFLLLISGSVFLQTFFNKRFCETLPLTCMIIPIILYIFCLFNGLLFGVYFTSISLLILLVISCIHNIRTGNMKAFASKFFSPGFILFIVMFVVLYVLTYKKVASGWDEFSYWLSSVKDITYYDDFITNPNSHVGFKSYPPIMGMFQYFFEKIYQIVSNRDNFFEGLAFFAYRIFCLSFFFPFFKKESFKNVLNIVLTLCIFLVPCFFFGDFYNSIYIDPFIGILTGTALAQILLNREKKYLYYIFISLNTFVLVLAKDVGLYFAIFVSIIFSVDYFFRNKSEIQKHNVLFHLGGVVPLLSVLSAKISWKVEVISSNAPLSFSAKYDFPSYIKMFFLHNDNTYKQNVVDNFKSAFFENRFPLGNFFDIEISFFFVTIFACVLLLLIYLLYRKENNKKLVVTMLTVVLLMLLLYIFSLGATYVARFSEYEATKLASYERYLNIVFLGVYIFCSFAIYDYLIEIISKKRYVLDFIVLLLIGVFIPKGGILKFILGVDVEKSLENRNKYISLTDKIEIECKEKSKICFISQEDNGYDILVMQFVTTPNILGGPYSIGPAFYEGDIWTSDITLEEFKDILFTKDYDYLAIFKTNDYFNETYAPIFENPDDIADNTLFRINKTTGKVELCQ